MDNARFDSLIRAWAAASTRRGLLGLLVALLGLGGLAPSVASGEVGDAGGRRQRRKKRHKHGKGRRRNPKKSCRSDSRAKTCAGKCGTVKSNCRKTVDCGPCACEPACAVCQRCDEITGTCLPDPTQEGESCGPGQFCRDDGRCACEANSCGVCETCQEDGVCSAPCDGGGCCAGDHCEPGDTIAACGVEGEGCQVCADDELCWNGRCVCGDVCADGCQFATIQAAIDAAEPEATIRLCAETYPRSVHITKSLTLLGVGDGENGTILDGQGRSSTVHTRSDTVVTLHGLRITGGAQPMAGSDGGGVVNIGTLTLIECTVTGNYAADAGGGIYNDGGHITLRNTRVIDNAADIEGGGIYSAFETLTLEDCVVSGNTARRGGSIFVRGGTVELINTEVTDNVAQTHDGGAILNWGILRLTNSQITENTSATRGGGIHNGGGTVTLTTSHITDNTAEEGGGVYNDRGTVTLIDSTVTDNTPDNCAGDPVAGCSG